MNLKKEVGSNHYFLIPFKSKDNVDHALAIRLANPCYLHSIINWIQNRHQDCIFTLVGKLKVNMTKAKVGITSCKFHWYLYFTEV